MDHISGVDEFPASTAIAAIETDIRTASLAEPRGQTGDSCDQ
ncbi:hypothetical protein [Bradyrhizobium brasilense]|nr:hypothetical protein [Bradyrhizobium brasilense]